MHGTFWRSAQISGIISFPGGIAQLVERQLCKLDVRGSNPLASTKGKEVFSLHYEFSFTEPLNTESLKTLLGPVAQLVRACA